MQHSFSSQSFLKSSKLNKSPKNRKAIYFQDDNTLPKEYFSSKESCQYQQNESGKKSNFSCDSMQKLRNKIKQVKLALKIAQQHNGELHQKLSQQKNIHNEEKRYLQTEVRKFKDSYQMMMENYEARSLQLKEARKRIKRYERQQQKSSLLQNTKSNVKSPSRKQIFRQGVSVNKSQEQSSVQIKQILAKQQVGLQHLTYENNLLREDLMLKNKKVSQYAIMVQAYQCQERLNRLSPKQSKQISQLKSALKSSEKQVQKLHKQKQITLIKLKNLQIQAQSLRNSNNKFDQQKIKLEKQQQQLLIQLIKKDKLMGDYIEGKIENKRKLLYQDTNHKYTQVLKFSYDIQKNFEKELNKLHKQITRREILKNSSNR